MKRVFGVAMVLALGCVSGSDGIPGELSAFDPGEYQDQIVYLHPDFAAPLTADELGADLGDAIPVGIRVHAHFAVAWHAPLGEPRVGNADSVIRAWQLYDGDAVPLSSDVVVEPGDDTTVETPGIHLPNIDVNQTVDDGRDREYFYTPPPRLNLIWLEEWRDAWVQFWSFHPECA